MSRLSFSSFKHQINKSALLTLVIAFGLLSIVGSGGGGGGTPTQKPTTTISGTALAPNGVVAQLSNQTFMYALNEFLFPSARADITGLDPVTGALVELIEVNDAGDQVGAVLVSTATSITGDYKLELPAGVNLAANLVVRISGTSVDLRAMVVQTSVDITPLSEFLLRKFITSGAALATLNVSDVATLSGHAAEFDVAATSDLSSMIAALEAQLGTFVDEAIIAIDSMPGTASSVAGEYHIGRYETGFDYTNDAINAHTVGGQKAYSLAGLFTLIDEGGDSIGLIDNGSTGVDTGLFIGDQLHYGLIYQVNTEQGGQIFKNIGSVNSSGDINFTFPFGEEINPSNDLGERRPPTSGNSYATGVAGVRIGAGVNPWALYHLVDTNGDGIKDAIDPAAYIGHIYAFTLGVMAPQASAMTQSAIAGDYGSVSFVNLFAAGGDSSVYGEVSKAAIDASGIVIHSQKDADIITRTPDSTGTATFAETTDTTPKTGTISVSSNGQFTYTEDGTSASLFGFASNNAEFLMASVSESEGVTPDFTMANNGISLSVKQPSTTPDLSGRTYRLMGIEKQMNTTGEIRFERLRGDDDRLIFSDDGTQVTISYNGTDIISRNSDISDFTSTTDTNSEAIDHTVTIAGDGAINFTQTVTGTDGFTREWKGFVSDSNNIIILRSIERADDGSGYKIGIYVAIPVL